MKHLDYIQKAIEIWLSPDNQPLQNAISKTVEKGLFSHSDVAHAVNHLHESLRDDQLRKWYDSVNELKKSNIPTRVLCLHAGNLPLVGFQDLLVTLVSGAHYSGKLSRKDPYLIASFIEVLREVWVDAPADISTNIMHFKAKKFPVWMFSGSDASLKTLETTLINHQIIDRNAKSLRRTAHFSAVILSKEIDSGNYARLLRVLPDLLESVMRYSGKGCRSVALIYSNVPLKDVREIMENAAQEWVQSNKIELRNEIVRFRKAYNTAVGIPQADLTSHLIQESTASPDHPEIVYWLPVESPQDIKASFGNALQTIYTDDEDLVEAGFTLEPLHKAQKPDISWRPDGVDPLKWLLTQN
jgi:hypothetical protein